MKSQKKKIVYSMNEVYSEFKEHVMQARNMSEEDLEKICRWSCVVRKSSKRKWAYR